jgi:hypothetical protein
VGASRVLERPHAVAEEHRDLVHRDLVELPGATWSCIRAMSLPAVPMKPSWDIVTCHTTFVMGR